MSLSKTSVRKPVTVLIICILIAVLGINAMSKLPLELLPNMDIPYIVISTSYTGASPEEVEEKITKTLESSLSSVAGLNKISSTSGKGSSTITMEFVVGTNLDEASNTIRDRIDLVKKYLPEDAGTPTQFKIDMSIMPLMIMVLDSPSKSAEELKILAEDIVAPRLEQIDGVASTTIIGGRERAIRIEIPKDRLEGYGLSFSQIAQMVAAQNINSSMGSIIENGLEYTVESQGTFDSVEEIANTVISYKAGSDGQIREIRLGEIADVYDGYKDASSHFYMGDRDCVAVTVSKQTEKNTVVVSNKILGRMDQIKEALPDDCTMDIVYNSSDEISKTIDQVTSSAVQGAILAILILLFFLRSGKSTVIIGITIPLSVVLTLLVMYYSNLTLNLMTLAGLALGIGMLVDNAIVILENIYSYRERGTKPQVASVLGSEEMASAITSSTLTTICVFLPMIMYQSKLGMIGQVFNQLALTVVISLVSSLALALTLVPVLTGKYLVEKHVNRTDGGKIYNFVGRILDAIDNFFAKTSKWVFEHKKFFILCILILFVFSCVMIKVMGFVYMPDTEESTLTVSFEMPKGTALDETSERALDFNRDIMSVLKGVDKDAVIVGSGMGGMGGSSGSNTASLMFVFFDAAERQTGWDTASTAKQKILALKENYPDADISISSQSQTGSVGGSSGISITVKSTDLDACRATSKEIEALLKDKAKNLVSDVSSSMSEGLPQVSIVFDRDKMYSLGVNIATANAEIKANVGGMTCARYSDGGSDVDVVLSLPDEDLTSIVDINNIMVSSSFGYMVPLAAFANVEETRGALSIARENQSRVVTINASSKDGVVLSNAKVEVQKLIDENIVLPEGVMVSFAGDYESMIEFLMIFIEIILIAILMVFAIMASQFESFKSPFIVLFTLPLGLIGIVLMYIFFGVPFNVLTAVGALILVGVVVNNGIVLVDYTNLLRKRGMSLADACLEASKSRLRPVLMTTLTTVLALTPMAFFPGEGGEMVQHVGITVFGGLTFGTIMTLYLIPCLYYLFNRKQEKKEALHEEA